MARRKLRPIEINMMTFRQSHRPLTIFENWRDNPHMTLEITGRGPEESSYSDRIGWMTKQLQDEIMSDGNCGDYIP